MRPQGGRSAQTKGSERDDARGVLARRTPQAAATRGRMTQRLPARCLCLPLVAALLFGAREAAAQSTHLVLDGAPGEAAGFELAAPGDLDGDGVPDVLVGSQGGWARAYSGADGALLREWRAPYPFGSTVGAAGDVDGDGVPDAIVGAPDAVGYAIVWSGATGALLHLLQPPPAEEDAFLFGAAVDGAGDVDADGFSDVIVGAPLEGGGGVVRVYGGLHGGVLHVLAGAPASSLGQAVAACGDLDGDGHADVAAGAPAAGTVTAVSGRTGRVLLSLAGRQPSDDFGAALAGAGDTDGDGVPDLVVGAPGAGAAGAAYVVAGAGGATLHAFEGDLPLDAFGFDVCGAGDGDGDGLPDVLAGSTRIGAGAIGYARLGSGRQGGTLFTAAGSAPVTGSDLFGWSVAGLGDLDGDGHADVAVAAPFDDDGGAGAGRVSLVTSPAPFPTVRGGVASGSGELPHLDLTCSLHAGDLLSLVLQDAPPSSPCFLVLGTHTLGAPFGGGVLVPQPELIHLVGTDPSGLFVAAVPWPPGVPGGFTLQVQAWIPDAGAAFGYAGTDAVVVSAP